MSSDYEKLRAENIKRNEEIMKMLGLDSEDFRLHAQEDHEAKAGGKKAKQAGDGAKRKKSVEGSNRGSPKKRGKVEEPSRRSARVQGIEAEFGPKDLPHDFVRGEDGVHEQAEEEYNRWAADRWAGKQGRQTIVGTASYAHTLMRVRTMSEDALAKRITAIERAKGKHAVVKMKLFAQILCLERYEELSADATRAYQRLVEVLGEPKKLEEEEAEEEQQ